MDFPTVIRQSARRYRNEVALFHDLRAAPNDLQRAISTGVDVGEPDIVALGMGPDPDNSPHHHVLCGHSRTLAVLA